MTCHTVCYSDYCFGFFFIILSIAGDTLRACKKTPFVRTERSKSNIWHETYVWIKWKKKNCTQCILFFLIINLWIEFGMGSKSCLWDGYFYCCHCYSLLLFIMSLFDRVWIFPFNLNGKEKHLFSVNRGLDLDFICWNNNTTKWQKTRWKWT